MTEQSVIHNTFVIERSYPHAPERVFAAFANPATKQRWFSASEQNEVERFELDFRVGGAERMQYRFKEGTPIPGAVLASDGTYLEIVPNRCVVIASAMTLNGRRISASLLTIELLPTETGTDLICTHQGAFFEGADGPEMRQAGWCGLLDRLAAELSH
jgi:uncharacterized protein YndB with AHSA1/START domain